MRKIVTISVASMIVLSACQPADQGLNNPNNNTTDYQQTRFGDQGTNNLRDGNRNPNNMNNFNNDRIGNNTTRDGGLFNNNNNNTTRDGGFFNDNNTTRDRGTNNFNNNRSNFNDNNTQLNNRTGNNTGQQGYQVADRIADRVTDQVDEVERAYVLAGNDNAYVAVVLDREQNAQNNNNNNNNNENYDIGDRLKERISDAVKDSDNTIENVYVSANPDFLQMVDDYVNDVQDGEPIEGFFEEFNNMLDRIFPNLQR